MKSLRSLSARPAASPVLADEVLEFHAARLLLLIKVCGIAGRIDGLTKLAKLDFFVRYPKFFHQISDPVNASVRDPGDGQTVESSMIRFHYGPWDPRYYHVLSYLEAKALISVSREGTRFRFSLTDLGRSVASKAEQVGAFTDLVTHMRAVKALLGGKAGSTLKDLVYKTFGKEVAMRSLGEVIK